MMVEELFEPGLESLRRTQDFSHVALASIAISMKRIADAATGQVRLIEPLPKVNNAARRHKYQPHRRHPQFCGICGYSASETLMHDDTMPAKPQR